jgi:FkbM family methyltransferase
MTGFGFLVALLISAVLLTLAVVAYRSLRSQRLIQQALATKVTSAPDERRLSGLASGYELVESRHGPMLVNSKDRYLGQAVIAYGECCELEVGFLIQLLSLRPGLVIEIGTNIGTHTIPLARSLEAQGRRMIVFEPQPIIFQNLCANLALNGLGNVAAWPFACGDRDATVHFARPDYAADGNFGGVSMAYDATENNVAVPCRRLDDLVRGDDVAMIKVDVEGFELAALAGAVDTLARCRPILYVENDRPEKSAELIAWLLAQDYRLWWHIPALFNPDNFFGNQENLYPGVASFNMLGLPKELDVPVGGLQEIHVNTTHPLAGR